jgi:hypothetical protein
MSYELLFWVLMLLWIIFGFAWNSNPGWAWGVWPNSILMWVLLAILGWKVFGPMLHG